MPELQLAAPVDANIIRFHLPPGQEGQIATVVQAVEWFHARATAIAAKYPSGYWLSIIGNEYVAVSADIKVARARAYRARARIVAAELQVPDSDLLAKIIAYTRPVLEIVKRDTKELVGYVPLAIMPYSGEWSDGIVVDDGPPTWRDRPPSPPVVHVPALWGPICGGDCHGPFGPEYAHLHSDHCFDD